MPLERDHHVARRFVEMAVDREPIAIVAQRGLEILDRVAAVAEIEARAGDDRRRLYPMADARAVQHHPGKFLARIALARRRRVRMRKHALGPDDPPAQDRAA